MRAFRGIAARARRDGVLVLAAALFAAIFALRMSAPDPAHAILVLCVVPIVICAIDRGPLGGALAGVVGLALTAVWSAHAHAAVGVLGYVSRGVAFLVVGLIAGRYAADRRAFEHQLDRAYEVAVDLQCTPAWTATSNA